ncbi:SRPBCC family protein [Leucobacter ruminantium]|uniref:SRPBCC family protein n=1 Tax=Leucobacter ruminantium TaxID=1289170 RepID=A0A939LU44_9MICO|nr:SRPBCC family protein [Leucobacter ruminantium]MBO1804814.1 SRPBCC family protein [Leucobacter ruminantium]
MTVEASGRVIPTERGSDLVLVRSLALTAEEAWAHLTDSELTEQWFGPWEGDARAGGAVRVRMRFEDHEPAIRILIRACEAPSRLVLEADDEVGGWKLELLVEEDGADDALLTFIHHLEGDDVGGVGEIGPGWEYYLDLLVAATEGTERPAFDDYYPALREAYLSQL